MANTESRFGMFEDKRFLRADYEGVYTEATEKSQKLSKIENSKKAAMLGQPRKEEAPVVDSVNTSQRAVQPKVSPRKGKGRYRSK